LQENERSERLQHEKEAYRTISDEVYTINEKIDREKTERGAKIAILREEMLADFSQRDKVFGQYQDKLNNEMKVLKDEIYGEMDNRFSHQNEIVDNISNFLKTFQITVLLQVYGRVKLKI
jgi:hypothetical protein